MGMYEVEKDNHEGVFVRELSFVQALLSIFLTNHAST